MPIIPTLIAVIAALLAGVGIGIMHAERRHLLERIAKLEAASIARLPFSKIEDIDNARAAFNQLVFERDRYDELISNAAAWFDRLRSDERK